MIEFGDCRDTMRRWVAEGVRVQMCVTSPPYWGLRDYGVDGQLGLEPTPEAYVANMVEVFRLVRDLLADDGTCWVNMGDSFAYNGACGGSSPDGPRKPRETDRSAHQKMRYRVPPGLKPKDLVGIPWAVATALRDPYYSGRIKRVEDRIWLAAMLDAEGCMFIHRRKAGQHNGQGYYRQNDSFGPGVEIANTSLAVIERVMALVGKGSICSQGPEENARRKQRIYRWNLRTVECRDFVQEVYPYLVAKQQQARILFHCPPSGEKATAAHLALIQLHRKGQSDVDFPEIPSLFQTGYYLRSDVIWSKCNPMPESVTDRPTKAHEYLFLLSKRERYYYDAKAIAEPFSDDRMGNPGAYRWKQGAGGMAGGGPNSLHKGDGTVTGWNIDRSATSRNRRTVWEIATQPYSGAHFAIFPEALVARVAIRFGRRAIGCELNPAGARSVHGQRDRYEALQDERTTITGGLALT